MAGRKNKNHTGLKYIVLLENQGNKRRSFNIYKKGDKYIAKGLQDIQKGNKYFGDPSAKLNKVRKTANNPHDLIKKIGSKYKIKGVIRIANEE